MTDNQRKVHHVGDTSMVFTVLAERGDWLWLVAPNDGPFDPFTASANYYEDYKPPAPKVGERWTHSLGYKPEADYTVLAVNEDEGWWMMSRHGLGTIKGERFLNNRDDIYIRPLPENRMRKRT